jgi:hypothetical protein
MDTKHGTERGDFRKHDVEGGPFQSVEQAMSLLHAQESWVAEHRAENNAGEVGDSNADRY